MESRRRSWRRAPACIARTRQDQASRLEVVPAGPPNGPEPSVDSAAASAKAAIAAAEAAEAAAATAMRAATTPPRPAPPVEPSNIIIESAPAPAKRPGSVTLSVQMLVGIIVCVLLLSLLVANIVELSRTHSAIARLANEVRLIADRESRGARAPESGELF